jgi:hypothetical protein
MKSLVAAFLVLLFAQCAFSQNIKIGVKYYNVEGDRAQKMFEAAKQANILGQQTSFDLVEEDRFISQYFIGDIRCESKTGDFECSVNDVVLNGKASKTVFAATSNLTESYHDDGVTSTYATDLSCIVETHKNSRLVEYRCLHAVY